MMILFHGSPSSVDANRSTASCSPVFMSVPPSIVAPLLRRDGRADRGVGRDERGIEVVGAVGSASMSSCSGCFRCTCDTCCWCPCWFVLFVLDPQVSRATGVCIVLVFNESSRKVLAAMDR